MNEPAPPPSTGIQRIDMVQWFTDHRERMCLLPWLNIHTNTDGKIKLCCNIHLDHFVNKREKDEPFTHFNFGHDDIDAIWNSTYMRSSRIKHHSNKGCAECEGCYNLEKTTGHSPKIGQNQLWNARLREDEDLRTYMVDQVLGKVAEARVPMLPVSLELRLGNQCNLQCVSCWGMSSSLIHEERKDILKTNILEEKNMSWLRSKWTADEEIVDSTQVKDWFETDTFYSNFKKLAPTLRRLYTTGGEPTLIKSNYKMFQMLIDEGNTDCRIEFTSNMTTWNPEFYKRLEKFTNVEIQMSVDGVDEIGEYIRYPSDFSKVKENIFKAAELVSTRPGWTVKCFTVLQALNCQYIGDIWDVLAEACAMYDINIDWWPITLDHPHYLSLKAAPLEIRQRALEDLNNTKFPYRLDSNIFHISNHTWQTLSDAMLNIPYDVNLNLALFQAVNLNDTIRQSDGEILFADILIENLFYDPSIKKI